MIGRMTYLDLTPEQRKQGANKTRERIRELMANPFLVAPQRKFLQEQLVGVDLWEKGQLPSSK